MGFLELRQARGVYSRVATGMPILNGSLFRLEMGVSGNLWIVVKDVKTLVVYDVE